MISNRRMEGPEWRIGDRLFIRTATGLHPRGIKRILWRPACAWSVPIHSDDSTLAEALGNGLDRLRISYDDQGIERLLRYLQELSEWNRSYNLTAVRDPGEMVVRHLLDCAAIAPWVRGPELLDVGAGAGLPGIPLAILNDALHVTLLDSNGKKVRFMRHALRTLGLRNARVVHERLEDHAGGPFDAITARAFADPATLLAAVRTLCRSGGRVYAMVGRVPEPLPEAHEYEFERCVNLDVPGLEGERHLLIYRRCPESSQ